MRRAFAPILIASAATALIAAGCGGSSSSALSKPDFLAQGNAICKKGNDKINAAFKGVSSGKPSTQQIAQVAKQTMIPEIQAEIDGVDNLAAPKGDEAAVKNIVDEAQAALAKAKADPSLLAGNQDPFAQANKDSLAYGLKECGGGN